MLSYPQYIYCTLLCFVLFRFFSRRRDFVISPYILVLAARKYFVMFYFYFFLPFFLTTVCFWIMRCNRNSSYSTSADGRFSSSVLYVFFWSRLATQRCPALPYHPVPPTRPSRVAASATDLCTPNCIIRTAPYLKKKCHHFFLQGKLVMA